MLIGIGCLLVATSFMFGESGAQKFVCQDEGNICKFHFVAGMDQETGASHCRDMGAWIVNPKNEHDLDFFKEEAKEILKRDVADWKPLHFWMNGTFNDLAKELRQLSKKVPKGEPKKCAIYDYRTHSIEREDCKEKGIVSCYYLDELERCSALEQKDTPGMQKIVSGNTAPEEEQKAITEKKDVCKFSLSKEKMSYRDGIGYCRRAPDSSIVYPRNVKQMNRVHEAIQKHADDKTLADAVIWLGAEFGWDNLMMETKTDKEFQNEMVDNDIPVNKKEPEKCVIYTFNTKKIKPVDCGQPHLVLCIEP